MIGVQAPAGFTAHKEVHLLSLTRFHQGDPAVHLYDAVTDSGAVLCTLRVSTLRLDGYLKGTIWFVSAPHEVTIPCLP